MRLESPDFFARLMAREWKANIAIFFFRLMCGIEPVCYLATSTPILSHAGSARILVGLPLRQGRDPHSCIRI